MPMREEKITHIEAALRRRFFLSVPKIEKQDRINWPEDQHDTDRLSRSMAAYTLVGVCGIDDTTAVGAITDSSNDGGIDALFYDRVGNRLVFVQSKFKRTGAAPSQDEVLKTINGIKALQDRRFDEFNDAFRNRLDEIEEALDTAGIKIELVLSFLGDNFGIHAKNDLDAFRVEMNRLSPLMDWRPAGLDVVYTWLVAEQTPACVNDHIMLDNWASITMPRKTIYGQISATSLAQLVEKHGKALFERNIRHYLGSIGVNRAIENAVRSQPRDFFYLNNGITAVAETITRAAGNQSRCAFGLTNFSIVNGAQTAGAIASAMMTGEISADAKLLITVIEIGSGTDDIGLRITRARNHQNVVRGVDFAALDPKQERLRQELAMVGITYHYRPSAEARARRDDAFTLEEAALAMACLAFPLHAGIQIPGNPRSLSAIDFVVTAKKEIGRLWEQEGPHYTQLFAPSLSGLRMCRMVRIYRFIDQILASTERSETSYFRRMFFRHGRYFTMAFVAHRSAEVLRRPELVISTADQTLLSQKINEISELIYAQSQPLQASKGYLSIFRNLTDSQPLADQVLQRLAQQDAQQKSAAAIAPNT
ncbi:MAG: AIPR family protein [Planctomycetota bacterium]